jgi:hypothetical protein
VHHAKVFDIQDSRPGLLFRTTILHLIGFGQGVVVCKTPCNLEGVTDLAAIPLTSTPLITVVELESRKVKNPGVENLQWPFLFALLVDVAKPLNIELPYVEGLVLCQWRIVDLVVDP